MTTEIVTWVGLKLRALRLARRLTLEQVGQMTAMTKGQVGKIECGAPRTSIDQYADLAAVLGLTLEELFRSSPPSRLSRDSAAPRKGFRGARPAKRPGARVASRRRRAVKTARTYASR